MSKPFVNVEYFAALREATSLDSEQVFLHEALSAEALYAMLAEKYSFPLKREQVRFAVNNEFCDPRRILQPADTVAFIPPVAGG